MTFIKTEHMKVQHDVATKTCRCRMQMLHAHANHKIAAIVKRAHQRLHLIYIWKEKKIWEYVLAAREEEDNLTWVIQFFLQPLKFLELPKRTCKLSSCFPSSPLHLAGTSGEVLQSCIYSPSIVLLTPSPWPIPTCNSAIATVCSSNWDLFHL